MEYIQLTISILTVLVGIYLAFVKSYFTEKGRNLATKQDISQITKEIETVKGDIISSIQRKNEYLKEGKEIALTFQDNATWFVDFASNVVNGLVHNDNNVDYIAKRIEEINLHESKILSLFLKLRIYFGKCDLTGSAEFYYNSTVKLHLLSLELLYKVINIDQKKSIMLKSLLDGNLKYKDEILVLTSERKLLIDNQIFERKNLLNNEVMKTRSAYMNELSKIVKDEKITAHNTTQTTGA